MKPKNDNSTPVTRTIFLKSLHQYVRSAAGIAPPWPNNMATTGLCLLSQLIQKNDNFLTGFQ
jgi:hypothetical protein